MPNKILTLFAALQLLDINNKLLTIMLMVFFGVEPHITIALIIKIDSNIRINILAICFGI